MKKKTKIKYFKPLMKYNSKTGESFIYNGNLKRWMRFDLETILYLDEHLDNDRWLTELLDDGSIPEATDGEVMVDLI